MNKREMLSFYVILSLIIEKCHSKSAVSLTSNSNNKPHLDSIECIEDENSAVNIFCSDGSFNCLPRLFILGAAKSSTTSLWALMRRGFPDICSPIALQGDPLYYRYIYVF